MKKKVLVKKSTKMLPSFLKHFNGDEKEVYSYLAKNASKYDCLNHGVIADNKIRVIVELMYKRKMFSKEKIFSYFGGISKASGKDDVLSKYFNTEKDLWNYMKKEAHKYENIYQAGKSDKAFIVIRNLASKKIIDKSTMESFFGGKRTIKQFYGIYFKNEKEVFCYLNKNAKKYKSFCNAIKIDVKMSSIRNLMIKKRINKEKVYSFFGGRKNTLGTNDFSHFFKNEKEVRKYLKENSSKYKCFDHACKADIKMRSIRQICMEKLPVKVLYEYFVYGGDGTVCEQREHKAMVKLEKTIEKKISGSEIQRELRLAKRSRVDLCVTINQRKILIEGKHDDSFWTAKAINKQVGRYNNLGKSIYKENFHSVILCSPKGRYGISFDALIDKLLRIKAETEA